MGSDRNLTELTTCTLINCVKSNKLFHFRRVTLSFFLFDQQRIGYLAASQCFHESTDVIMLTTNQIRKVIHFSSPSLLFKSFISLATFFLSPTDLYFFYSAHQDLSSPNQYDTGVALTGLSCFVTPDLARDLANDIMTLVSSGGTVARIRGRSFVSQQTQFNPEHQVWVVLLLLLRCRCPTRSPTSGRKRYWSCTRCS